MYYFSNIIGEYKSEACNPWANQWLTDAPEKEDDVEESDGGGGEYVSPTPEIACRDNMRGFILPLFGVNKFNSGSAGNWNPLLSVNGVGWNR